MTAFSHMNALTFSFLMPTRNRVPLVSRFLQSVMDTTAHIDRIEVVLAVDDDDSESQRIIHETLPITKVRMPTGATMGNLNRACFAASSGRYVMLINDDVILRTKNWDVGVTAAFARYPDDVGLIHVNDLLFREKFCTFPILSRKACLEIGICHGEYQRYKIDDDIYAIYNMLAHLGHKRITYLPEVIFEHENFEQRKRKHRKSWGSLYIADDDKVYLTLPEFHDHDARIFEDRLEDRKKDALRLAGLIESNQSIEQRRSHERKLAELRNPYEYVQPGFVRTIPAPLPASSNTRVTVAVVTSDISKKHAQRCIGALKKHTANFDLVILDNNNSPDFVPAREMNKVLRSVNTDFLVLLDDDVFVEAGWLDGLLVALDDETGVVAPMHKDGKGVLSFSGVYLMGDNWGTHAHLKDWPDRKRECQCTSSALLFIDMRKCGSIQFDEQYKRYFFDLEYSFRVWEAGYKVVCTPDVTVTHLGGATMDYYSRRPQLLFNQDVRTFVEAWIATGRLQFLADTIWSRHPQLKELASIPHRINDLFSNAQSRDNIAFSNELHELLRLSQVYQLFKALIYHRVCEYLNNETSCEDAKSELCEQVRDQLKEVADQQSGPLPVRLEFYKGYELVDYRDRKYAVPVMIDYRSVADKDKRKHREVLSAETSRTLKEIVDEHVAKNGQPGGGFNRLIWELTRLDAWLRKGRRTRLADLASRTYVRIPRRFVVALAIRWKRYATR